MNFDPSRILQILAKHRVEYVVVGGIGGTLHGSPMTTDDVDIVPALKKTNLDSLAGALNEMNTRILSQEDTEGVSVQFTGKDLQQWIVDFRFLNLSTDHGKLDLIYRPSGTGGFRDLARNAETLTIGDIEVRVSALEDIIRSKQAAARARDLAQLPTLRMLLEKRTERLTRPDDQV
jgi:hypothetical protein